MFAFRFETAAFVGQQLKLFEELVPLFVFSHQNGLHLLDVTDVLLNFPPEIFGALPLSFQIHAEQCQGRYQAPKEETF